MDSAQIILDTPAGRLRGEAGSIRRFLGLPYACPPIGELRWRPPLERQPWPGIREATAFGPDSFQDRDAQLRGIELSEDCLYLNIWSPAEPSREGLPVMVWIHGNGYTRGSGSHATYDGEALASFGVVVVTVNYRLGLAGFLAHPELTAESDHDSSGNYGLLDQVAALRWVQRNIAAFGGDPARVTVFGQSAGATCTHLLMSSQLGRGLFSQAILHSPGSMRPMAGLPMAENAGLKVGSSIARLRELSIAELWSLTARLVPPVRRLASPRGLGPIIDGWIIRGDDMANYREGRVSAMPTLVGVTQNEGRRLTERMPIQTAPAVREHLVGSFGSLDAVPAAYRPSDDATAPAMALLDRAVGDTQFNYGALAIAREMARLGAPVYRYVFAHLIPGCTLPPTHDDELPYVFGTLRAGNLWRGAMRDEEISDQDWLLSRLMGECWTSFARTGAPRSDDLPPWPPFTGEDAMMFDAEPRMQLLPASEGLQALEVFFGHHRVPDLASS